ncbi:MAG: ATP-binding response regulator [Gemmatimonadaceae bacterium]
MSDGTVVTPSALRVLVVEDNPGDAELLVETLDDVAPGDTAFSCRCVVRLADARVALDEWPADVVLLDLTLPDGRGLDSLAAVRAAAPELPVVVMTGLADDAIALRALQAGAQDYLVKGRDGGGAIRRAVRHAVERQRLVSAARQAANLRDEVLAIVSHDLRNPLGTIGMCAEALLDPGLDSFDSVRSTSDIIRRSCDWMMRLIEDLLDVARVESGTLTVDARPVEPGAVMEMVETMYRPLALERPAELIVSMAPDLPLIQADTDRVVQALGNLISNALAFTPAGGRVTVVASRVVGVDGGVDGGMDGGVRFSVADTGCGIAPEHLGHIFDRFWRARETRRSGAGLGLAIVRGLMEAHGGSVTVESVPGVGTTFTCTIPAAPAG